MNKAWECVPAASTTALTTATRNREPLTNVCPGSLIGRPGRISCNFPNAIFDPQNDTDPTTAANVRRLNELLFAPLDYAILARI